MTAKLIKFDDKARQSLLLGVEQLSRGGLVMSCRHAHI